MKVHGESLERNNETAIPNDYIYGALKPGSFRLLTLLPALKFEETIQCTVDDYELDDPTRPPHKALSYLWGDPSRTIPMLLQGKTANITENLHEALQYVRKNDRKIILWVDALCIDQQNIHERTAQVSQMRDIYTGADEVLAWLGTHHTGSERVFENLQHVWEQTEVDGGESSADPYENPLVSESLNLPFNRHNRLQLVGLLNRPYWRRIWILQEIAVATRLTLMCAECSIPWQALAGPLLWRQRYPSNEPADGIPNAEWIISGWIDCFDNLRGSLVSQPTTLARILLKCWIHGPEASDPRDLLYALLGFVTVGMGCNIVPDYSLSACAAFCSAIRAVYEDEGYNSKTFREVFLEASGFLADAYPLDVWIESDPHSQNCDGVECGMDRLFRELPMWIEDGREERLDQEDAGNREQRL